ncbi:MAG: crossover junction endodeoxyribonuclease RuvC [Bacteroidota bacterium]|nr:crossover junction endodeoxyribonuclease RuvC [Bacteroidota bacterium]
MRILGVDPGSIITGYGVVDTCGGWVRRVDSGAIAMRAGEPFADRLAAIYRLLIDVIDRSHPDVFCIETAFYGKNVQSTLKLGQVRGVAILAAAHRGLTVHEYSPREVKQAVTGNGAAAKHQIAYMVKKVLGLRAGFHRTDEADGLAVAICHAWRSGAHASGRPVTWAEFTAAHPERIRK